MALKSKYDYEGQKRQAVFYKPTSHSVEIEVPVYFKNSSGTDFFAILEADRVMKVYKGEYFNSASLTHRNNLSDTEIYNVWANFERCTMQEFYLAYNDVIELINSQDDVQEHKANNEYLSTAMQWVEYTGKRIPDGFYLVFTEEHGTHDAEVINGEFFINQPAWVEVGYGKDELQINRIECYPTHYMTYESIPKP